MRFLACIVFGVVVSLAHGGAAWAQSSWQTQDPDWPCAQRLVPALSAGSYWNGQVPTHTAWRDDDGLFALVPSVVDRDTPDGAAVEKVNAYVASLPANARAARLPVLFAAIVDQTNDERAVLIKRLKKLGRRQIGMGGAIAALSNRLDTMKPDDTRRDDVVGERDLDVRAFQETQHIVRYACEAPANMERRLGVLARGLQAK